MSDIETRTHCQLGSVTVMVKFDWEALGAHFMRAAGDEQALFLRGWDAEAAAIGFVNELHQYNYMSDALQSDTTAQSLAERLHRLADALDAEADW